MILKVVSGKELGGWSEAGKKVSLVPFRPNAAEARDQQDCRAHSVLV